MQELRGKTVLLLAPKFFGYEIEIKKELENLGAKVIYFDERPKNDFFTKVFIRLNLKSFIFKKIEEYYKNILESIKKENIDYLFLVNVETVPLKFIEKTILINPKLKVLTYFWDSVKNRKKSLEYLSYSNKFFSFDLKDAEANMRIEFLPLFYIDDYKNINNIENELIYDISFIGTVHSDRYKIIKQIEKQINNNNGLKTYFYFYSPSKILFFFQKLFKKDFKYIEWSDVSFKSLSKLDVIDVIEKSKCIIDIQHPLQTGLTMRTIEMLGAKKKILTTNSEIKKYDFYNSNNIFLLDRNNVKIDIEFFEKKYKDLNDDIYKKYSINQWLKTIFRDENE
ncbi:hypothetical protein [Arcobacter cloacae]|uniref:Uncharacterized protein n=1 Tax=Arcobacter cloacae TaxID=1054034 RepID=A0A6M8NJE0_9BACT|nr:hypothetical protein [Arcobacter cloacae]QKF90589.1 hypothetical protein ACLO_2124 [Arcobacter cloacae]RXI37593.1 hypothetical protein CP963_12315 [Arcobacter cloacae]